MSQHIMSAVGVVSDEKHSKHNFKHTKQNIPNIATGSELASFKKKQKKTMLMQAGQTYEDPTLQLKIHVHQSRKVLACVKNKQTNKQTKCQI